MPMKMLLWIHLVIVFLIIRVVWEWPSGQPYLVVCDVGQGDAILVTQGFSQMLVDTGNDSAKLAQCLSEQMPFWDRRLELVVLTHPEIDHIGAFAEIMQAYAVNNLLVPPVGNDTEEFKNIYHTISKSSIKVITAYQGQSFQWGEASLRVLWPLPQEASIWEKDYVYMYQNKSLIDNARQAWLSPQNPNDSSVVLSMVVEEVTTLLTGDISSQIELALVKHDLIDDIDVLKVAHHGSNSSSHELFLQTAKPEIALISAGAKNTYGHPHASVLARLEESNSLLKRTDDRGTIKLLLNRGEVWQERFLLVPDWISEELDLINQVIR